MHYLRRLILGLLMTALFSCQNDGEMLDGLYDNGGFNSSESDFKPVTGEILPEYFERAYRGEHRMVAGDLLEIMVIDHTETKVEKLPISPDGFVYYLMAQPVYAIGLSTSELKSRLERSIGEFFVDPKIFVRVQKSNNNTFQILGKIKQPGNYELDLPLRVREAIAMAGGLKTGFYRTERISLADLKNSCLIRDGKKLPIHFKNLIEQGNSKENIYMRPGDYIYIASALSKEVYILGGVVRPKAVYYTNNMTALQLLVQSNYNKDAHLAGAIILRKSIKSPKVIPIDLKKVLYGQAKDIYLEPSDILYIPEEPSKFIKDLAKTALRAFVQSFASDAGLFISTERIFGDD